MIDGIVIDFNEDEQIGRGEMGLPRRPRIFYDRVNYFELYNDHEFTNRFCISKDTFRNVLRLIEADISPPSQRYDLVLAPCKLFMMMRYLATGSFSLAVTDFSTVSESSACRYIDQVCRAIAKYRSKFIHFPKNGVDMRKVVSEFYRCSRFPRVVGSMDCTHIKIESPGGDNAETFRNRKGYFSIKTQCICDPSLKIMDIVARFPGSCHDQIIFDNSLIKSKFETGILKGYLLGDGGYKVKPYLMTPLLNPTTQSQQLYNESQILTRNVIDSCICAFKQRFPVLINGITTSLINTQAIIVVCAIIHNICIDKHDELPNNIVQEEDNNVNITEANLPNLIEDPRDEQERDRLIRDHFGHLE